MENHSSESAGGRGRRGPVMLALVLGLAAATYWLAPALLGGAADGERARVDEEWTALVARVVPPDEGAPWADSSLAAAAAEVDLEEGSARLLGAIGDGAAAPLPPRGEVLGLLSAVTAVDVAACSTAELAGLLRYGRRMQSQAPDLITLLGAVSLMDPVLDALLALPGGADALGGIDAPVADEFDQAFLREQVALQDWLGSVDLGDDALGRETVELALKIAVLEEVRWQEAQRGGGSAGGEAAPRAPESPGQVRTWLALWLGRPSDVADVVVRPLLAVDLASPRAAWEDHLERWKVASSGR